MSEMLDFLDGPVPGPDATSASAPVIETDRGADGRFIVKQPEPVAAPVAEPAPASTPAATADPVKPETGHVPLAAHLDEREKRQAAERRASELETRLQQQQQVPAERPDIDPDTANVILQTRLNLSEEMARDKYTDEVVDAAKAAIIAKFAENPAFQQEVLAKPNPYKFAVEWHKEQQRLEAVKDPTEWEKYQAWKAAGGLAAAPPAQAQPAAAAPTPAAPAAPPRSLAAAPSAGGNVTTTPAGPGVAFDNVITR